MTTEPLGSLFAALAKAQGEIQTALRSEVNPKENYRYADLASIWGACREALSKNALSVLQLVRSDSEGEGWVGVTTILGHDSGQSVETTAWLRFDGGPHSFGSAVTYLCKSMLRALVGVAADDDDGQTAAVSPTAYGPREKKAKRPSAADVPHDGVPIDADQVLLIHRLRKIAGGKWWTFDGDDENRADSLWRSTILGIYRDAAGERLTSTTQLCYDQWMHLQGRINDYTLEVTKRAARGFDVGDVNAP